MGEDTFQFDLEPADCDRVRVETAYMIARRGWPVEARIQLDRGANRILCSIEEAGGLATSAALALQVSLPEIGNLKLRTTLLPPRAEPYDLMLELARERMRQYLQKCEDWQMYSNSIAPEAWRKFEHARKQLASAVLAPDRGTEVALARNALSAAVQAGELLAASYADLLLHRRFANSVASETSLGFRVDPRVLPPEKDMGELGEFGVIMIETPWRTLQPQQGHFDFDGTDRWISWAKQHRIPVVLGPLVDLRPEVLPNWVLEGRLEYSELCKLIWEHQQQIVSRYSDEVAIWCVASGVHVNRMARLGHEQMIDITRRGAVLVRQAQRNAKVLVELIQPFDDEIADCPDSVRGYEYAVRALDEGVHIDCFGLRIDCGLPRNGCESRDLLSMSDAIDGIGRLERPLMITGFTAPAEEQGAAAGSWHEPWTPECQARWATSMYGIALGKLTQRGDVARDARVGVVESALWGSFRDIEGQPPTGLLDADGTPRKVMTQLAAVRRALRRPLGRSATPSAGFTPDARGDTK